MTKKLIVSLLVQNSDSKVGSVTAQGRFARSIEDLADDMEVIVTDCYAIERGELAGRTIDYLMLNEPPIELQDKNPGWTVWYWKLVDSLNAKQIGLQLHGEHTMIYDGKYDDYWMEVLKRVNSAIFQITPELCTRSSENIKDAVGRKTGERPQWMPVVFLPSTGIIPANVRYSDAKRHNPDICYASRIAPRKKPNNFIRLMGMIYPEQCGFDMYGEISPGIHNVQMEAEMANLPYPREEYYKGTFQSEYHGNHFYSNPSKDYLVVWGGAQIGRGNNCEMSPRIELAVLESLQNCTIPILFNETVPEWFPKDAYIGINWLDINHVSKVEGMQKSVDIIKEGVERIKALSPCEVEVICQKALMAVAQYTGVHGHLLDFINKVRTNG